MVDIERIEPVKIDHPNIRHGHPTCRPRIHASFAASSIVNGPSHRGTNLEGIIPRRALRAFDPVVSRAVVTRYINAPIGPPGESETHPQVIARALNLLRQSEHRVDSIASGR